MYVCVHIHTHAYIYTAHDIYGYTYIFINI